MNEDRQVRHMSDTHAQSAEFERMATELAVTFINLPPEQIDAHIEGALQRLVLFLGCDRSTLTQYDEQGNASATHCWAKQDYPRRIRYDPLDEYPYISSILETAETVSIVKLDTLPANAERDRKTMLNYGPRFMICMPLRVEGKYIGAITIGSFTQTFDLPQEMLNRLPLLSTIVASALTKKRMDLNIKKAYNEVNRLKNLIEAENCILQDDLDRYCLSQFNMVGASRAFKQLRRQIAQVAATDATVLILGETGTGKELVARSIHSMSSRGKRSMISLNCAAFSPELIDSELFGHEKGAFTGAVCKKLGRFEIADGSSLFFDEVGELTSSAQSKLLRFLQEKQFERVGSARPIRVDVRVLAATNRDLTAEMQNGRFREDLFYRLNVFPIQVPPLRERLDDIPLLVNLFISEFAIAMRKDVRQINSSDLQALQRYPWPGDVRELRNVVERAMILNNGPTLRISLPEMTDCAANVGSLQDAERQHILAALERTEWRVSGSKGAARILQINPKTLESRMRRLGISRATRGRLCLLN